MLAEAQKHEQGRWMRVAGRDSKIECNRHLKLLLTTRHYQIFFCLGWPKPPSWEAACAARVEPVAAAHALSCVQSQVVFLCG